MSQQIEGTCREVWVRVTGDGVQHGDQWLEIVCLSHEWECGHHHHRWTAAVRCMTRHVAGRVRG